MNASLLLLAALLASPPAALAAAPLDLTAGRYAVKLKGLLTRACVKAVLEEVRALPEVEKAGASLEKDELYLVIRLTKSLRAAHLQKALRRASKRVNLGEDITVLSVRYRVDTDVD